MHWLAHSAKSPPTSQQTQQFMNPALILGSIPDKTNAK